MKALSKVFALLFGLMLTTSCASGPAYDEFKASIPELSSDSGRIYIYRYGMKGYMSQPDVMLNGEKIGEAQANGFFYVDRPTGNYEIMISDEPDRKISFDLESNQTRYVQSMPGRQTLPSCRSG